MTELAPDEEAGVFRALADSTRRQILEDLRSGELTAGEIAARFPISGPSISRHLGVLKAAGLVRERRVANRVYYSLVEERLALSVGRFLSAICPEQVVIRQRRLRSTKTGAPDETAADDQRRRTTTPRELPGRP
ncbi:metalloregulator ArsR/SmtB family transcription factor [Nocardia thailandica]|uniref:metalloregulator ArsR/SmtB family transcription factor n=1 Tax=Nocardia thailandica TaxID=257275 RepID=UPI0002F9EEB1|nr:metalloregulator ArsR/SmtB family transcription factor [Nocardia thailandica]